MGTIILLHFFEKVVILVEFNLILEIMARCKQCDYPYASENKCTNCGSTNPTGRKGNFMGILIVVIILFALSKCS